MAPRKTRTPELTARQRTALLRRLKISPEVGWYLQSRGIPYPTCPPAFKTPEPRRLPGARFDPDRVDKVISAMSALQHTQGRWAGKPLRPDPWQVAYILAPVYGWIHQDSKGQWVRVARTEYVDVPRKAGKTTLAGAQALYLTGADGEPGAQVIAVAASKSQAGYCFDPVKQLANGSPAIKKHFRSLAATVVHKRSLSTFKVASSVADLLHGANISGAVIDELHVHKTRDTVDAVETGTGARAQPLIIIITTADASKQGTIYAEKRQYAEELSRRALEDYSFYAVIWAASPKDDPFAESTWAKANPGYGISPTKEFLEGEAKKARQSPANLARFLRLHLGIRTKQETKYLDLADWDRNASLVDVAALAGRECVGGLDLASTTDLAALCWLFPDADGGYDVLWRHWTPEANLPRLDTRTAGLASVWVREGWLTLTPGNVVDYALIRKQVAKDGARFDVRTVGYDPWNATGLVTDLADDGAPLLEVRQGYRSLSAPTKELQRLLLAGTVEAPLLRHGGNPLVRWQVDHFAVAMDPAGNVKPDKARASEVIDGLAATVIALHCAAGDGGDGESIYETEDLEVG